MPPLSAHHSSTATKLLVMGHTGTGKCLRKGTQVILYSGEVIAVENIKEGMILIGPDSKPRKVLSISSGNGPMYIITPKKTTPWICNENHVLTLKGTGPKAGKIVDIPMYKYLEKSKIKPGCGMTQFAHLLKQFSVGVDWPTESYKDVRIPYIMGLWLGDGRFDRPEIHCPDEEVIQEILTTDFFGLVPKRKMGSCEYVAITGDAGRTNWFTTHLLNFTNTGDKRIPKEYLINSRGSRLELLAGLVDTDGYLGTGYYEIITQYPGLAEDIAFLARSLGFMATIGDKSVLYKEGYRDYKRVNIMGDINNIPVRVKRKMAGNRKINKDPLVQGFSVGFVGNDDFYGFTLDEDGRFLLGDFTVTHNSGALASLAAAGYNLRILDMDNGLDVLKNLLSHAKSDYPKEAIERVSYVTLTEAMTITNGKALPTSARAWSQAMALLENWVDGDIKLGKVTTWGPQDILVIDTLTFLSTAAFNWVQSMNGRLGAGGTGFKGQSDIGAAQGLIRGFLEIIKSDAVKCNVIVNSHITFTNDFGGKPTIQHDDKGNITEVDERHGFPSAIGRALSPHIGEYFNTMLELRTVGQGPGARTLFFTKTQGEIGCKNTNPLAVAESYPLKTGLADYFKAVRGA